MDSIFRNAISSIKIGFEDFQDDDEQRIISSVRNIYAGVLLLSKEVLVRMSPDNDPDLLISKNIKPVQKSDGSIVFESVGTTTLDRHDLFKRFSELGIKIDQKPIEILSRIRNDIEHKSIAHPKETVEAAIANVLPLIADLLITHLGTDPAEALGDTWAEMLKVKEFYDNQLSFCNNTISKITFHSVTIENHGLICPECNSKLIEQEDPENTEQTEMKLSCRTCGIKPDTDSLILHTLVEATFGEAYIRMKDAAEDGPCQHCPECGNESYIDYEEACAICEYHMEVEYCERCGEKLTHDEIALPNDSGFCGYCNHMSEKIMRE
jgi:hypothetical protein